MLVFKISGEVPNLMKNNKNMEDGSFFFFFFFKSSSDVLKPWQIEKEFGPELSLFAKVNKCKLISPCLPSSAFQGFEPQIKWESEDMDILGASIGPKAHWKS